MRFASLLAGLNLLFDKIWGTIIFFASIVAMFYSFWLGFAFFTGAIILTPIIIKANKFLYERRQCDLPPIVFANFGIRFFRLCVLLSLSCFLVGKIVLLGSGLLIAVEIYNPHKEKIEMIDILWDKKKTIQGIKTKYGIILAPDKYPEKYVRVDNEAKRCLFSDDSQFCEYRFGAIYAEIKKLPIQDIEEKAQKQGYDLGAVIEKNKVYFGKKGSIGNVIVEDATPQFILPIHYSSEDFGLLFDKKSGSRWKIFIDEASPAFFAVYGFFFCILFILAALQYLIFGRWSQEWLMELDKGS